jgi:hypothetical protein
MKRRFDKLFRVIDRIVSGPLKKQILFFLMIVGTLFTVFLIVGIFFFSPLHSGESRIWNIVVNFIKPEFLPFYPGVLEKVYVLITSLAGMILFNGVLIALLTNTIFQRIDNIKNGEVYYNYNDHIIIIGFDNICSSIIAQLITQNEIVMQTTKDVPAVRQELFSVISDEFEKKIFIVSGDRTLKSDIAKLNVEKCKQVFILGEEDEDDHDSQNIECLSIISEIQAKADKNKQCHVLFKDRTTFSAFQQHEILDIRKKIDFVPFNYYDMWAQKIFVDNSYNDGEITYRPLDYKTITADSNKRVHLVILGMSNMGIALGEQAVQLCHFPNFITKGIKTRITFIDENADREMNLLKNRLRSFFEKVDYSFRVLNEMELDALAKTKNYFTEIELEFIKARFEDDEVQCFLEDAAREEDTYLTIAVALPDSSASLSTALYLPTLVYDSGASILVRQENSCALVSMLSKEEEDSVYRKYKNLRPFGMFSNSYDIKQNDDILPKMIKYAYDKTSFSEVQTIKDFPIEVICNNWLENWEKNQSISALKASNRYAANFIPVKQRSLGIQEGVDLTPEQINLAAQIEHNRWIVEKLLVGFRAATPEEAAAIAKDINQKRYYKAHFVHPDIKAYQDLGKDDKKIDVRIYDINISNSLPYMLKAYRLYSASK